MDNHEFVSKYSPLVKKNWLPLALGILGLMFFIYGLIGLFFTNKTASDEVIFEASSSKQNQSEAKTIFVDIEGAVANPGLYELPEHSRIQDALVAAGGIAAKADREYIAKNLNLAIKLTDGAKIYIPFVGEAVAGIEAVDGLININTGSQAQLETLSGIGPVTAKKIIDGRPYSAVDELLNKKIVGSSVFSDIKDKITVY